MRGDKFYNKMARSLGAGRLHPTMAAFLKNYLKGEKAIAHRNHWVINTHFPPFPSRAFDAMLDQMSDQSKVRRLYSATVGLTNRCVMRCWHCYNAGRVQTDLSLTTHRKIASQIQDCGAHLVTLTGGEPLLRPDLEEICAAYDDRSTLILGTTGYGLDAGRARRLADRGLFAMGVSLDSAIEAEHDALRGRKGAYQTALRALHLADTAGIYAYFVTLARPKLLERETFFQFMAFAKANGAKEVHLIEPCATGRLAGRDDVALSPDARQRIVQLQMEVAARDDLPILSTLTYLESPQAFGCGAGQTHIYIDGSGEVSPCNLVPLSFGNVTCFPLPKLLDRMARHFKRPSTVCIAKTLTPHTASWPLPTPYSISYDICEKHLPKKQGLPSFHKACQAAVGATDAIEGDDLSRACDDVQVDYDEHWFSQTKAPVEDLVRRLCLEGGERVLEVGTGTGYATVLLSKAISSGSLTGVDLPAGMLARAKDRLAGAGASNVTLIQGDALTKLDEQKNLDLVFTSWVLGNIPLAPFFKAAYNALRPGGRLALVVHREGSPVRELGIFQRIVSEEPSLLKRQVSFGFPKDAYHLCESLDRAGLKPRNVWEGQCIFSHSAADGALEHLLRSGAGTVFYDAIHEAARDRLRARFLEMLVEKNGDLPSYDVVHDYFACIATKPGSPG